MKKTFMFFLILILSWSVSNAQLYRPVQPYNESGYNIYQFGNFASNNVTDTTHHLNAKLSASYGEKQLEVVNFFLEKTGLNKNFLNGKPFDESWIPWIYSPERTWPEHRVYKNGFWNSHQSRDGKSVVWEWDKKTFDGMVLVLHLDGYELDLAKTICMNLVSVPYVIPKQLKQETTVVPSQRVSRVEFAEPIRINEKTKAVDLNLSPPKEEKDWTTGKIFLGGGIFISVGATVWGIFKTVKYFKNQHHQDYVEPVHHEDPPPSGGPGGAPPPGGD